MGLGNHDYHNHYVMPRDSKTTRFRKGIRITEKHYEWLRKNKGKKSAAGLLEQIIDSHIHIKKLF